MALDISFTLTDTQEAELKKKAKLKGLTVEQLLRQNMNLTNLKLKGSNSTELSWEEKTSFFDLNF